jgi:drug/metabolite transporter (DMT)-like permease
MPSTKKPPIPLWLLYCLIANALWALWSLVPAHRSAAMTEESMLVISTAGFVPAALLLAAFRPAPQRGHDRRGVLFALLTGLCGCGGNYLLLRALDAGGEISVVYPVTGIYPLVTVVLAMIFLGDRPSAIQFAGIGVALAAIILLNLPSHTAGARASAGLASWMNFSLGALALFGVSGITQRVSMLSISPAAGTLCYAGATVLMSGGIVAIEPLLSWDISPGDWAVALAWGILNAMAMVAQLNAYTHGDASLVTPVAALYPAITVCLAMLFYGATFTPLKAASVALAIFAGAMLSMGRAKGPRG